MELHIRGHDTIQHLLKDQYRKFDVVLYTNSNYDPPRFIETHCKEMIHMPIDDISKTLMQHDWMRGKVFAKREDIEKILEWTKGREKLICCCHAGVSRSSATAYIIACREWGPAAALSILRPKRHWPNRLIVKLGSEVLGDPEVWNRFVQWQIKETGLDPSKDFHYEESPCQSQSSTS